MYSLSKYNRRHRKNVSSNVYTDLRNIILTSFLNSLSLHSTPTLHKGAEDICIVFSLK